MGVHVLFCVFKAGEPYVSFGALAKVDLEAVHHLSVVGESVSVNLHFDLF